MEIHQKYGGVVPELASRQHLRAIVPVVREALERARMKLEDVDGIGVTQGPGLVGSLLVGLTYAKALALALGKPLAAVNHIEGHVHAVFLEARQRAAEPELPAVCLIVSGGHTVLYEVNGEQARGERAGRVLSYRRLGQTRDDAAGEAYDKVAKMLALGYPGGPVIDELAKALAEEKTGCTARLGVEPMRFGEVKIRNGPHDFSFSGMKTAVLYYLRKHPEFEREIAARREALRRGQRKAAQLLPLCSVETLELIASFQRTVVCELAGRTLRAAEELHARSVLVSGGVAANGELRDTFRRACAEKGLKAYFPSRELSTDNAAMIAAAAYPKLVAGQSEGNELNAEAVMPLA